MLWEKTSWDGGKTLLFESNQSDWTDDDRAGTFPDSAGVPINAGRWADKDDYWFCVLRDQPGGRKSIVYRVYKR